VKKVVSEWKEANKDVLNKQRGLKGFYSFFASHRATVLTGEQESTTRTARFADRLLEASEGNEKRDDAIKERVRSMPSLPRQKEEPTTQNRKVQTMVSLPPRTR